MACEANSISFNFIPIYEEQTANDLLLSLLQKHYAPSTIYPLQYDRPAISIGSVGPLLDHEIDKIKQTLEYLNLPLDTSCVLDRDTKNIKNIKKLLSVIYVLKNFNH